jgi:hypothetical protein
LLMFLLFATTLIWWERRVFYRIIERLVDSKRQRGS